jgi:hypothetical protein
MRRRKNRLHPGGLSLFDIQLAARCAATIARASGAAPEIFSGAIVRVFPPTSAKPLSVTRHAGAVSRPIRLKAPQEEPAVAAIHQVDDKTANWDADALRGSSVPVSRDCKRVFFAAKADLRKVYDLKS